MGVDSDRTKLTSAELFERARTVLAGGVSHENRFVAPFAKYVERARGARKWDVDGTEYIDYAMGSASLLLGHAHPDVVRAIAEQAAQGTFFADCHPLEVEWGTLVQRLVPSAERVRFVSSGSEATLLAMRLARAYSGRPNVLRFEGHYHGWHDYALLGAKAPYDAPPSLGVLAGALEATAVVPAGIEYVADALRRDPGIGAIICEVSGANYGSVPLPMGFLPALREIADAREVVLIFDEVITGFRWSPGGLQARDGVQPDITTLAKVLAGGMPGGAVVGREPIMRLLDPSVETGGLRPGVLHKGTFNASPLVSAAAVAALGHVETGKPQRHADGIARRLRDGMRGILQTHAIAGAVYGESSTFHVYIGACADGSVAGLSAATIRGVPAAVVAGLRTRMRAHGVDLMSYMSGVTSAAHGDEDVALTLEAFDASLTELLAQGTIVSG